MALLIEWSVKRSGAGLTISGVDAGGNAVTITGVQSIERRSGQPTLVSDKDGAEYQLS